VIAIAFRSIDFAGSEFPCTRREPPCFDSLTTAMTAVRHDSHVTLHYRLVALLDGAEREVANTFAARPATLQMGCGQFSPALEAKLIGLGAGRVESFDLRGDEAYGARRPELVQTLSRSAFDDQCEATDNAPGDVVEFNAPQGGRLAGVLKHRDEHRVVIDFNHPLAGVPLRWSVQVIGVL
jgi:FKBP-type peptidyl-prolyl cis-trans isomerase SlpA